jgi:integrase
MTAFVVRDLVERLDAERRRSDPREAVWLPADEDRWCAYLEDGNAPRAHGRANDLAGSSPKRASRATPRSGSRPTAAVPSAASTRTRAPTRARPRPHAIPFLRRLRLSEIEPRDLKQHAKTIGDKGVSAGTVRLALAPVKALLAEAFEEGLIRSNPAAGVRIARPEHTESSEEEARPLAPEKLERLLEELPAEWRLFYVFLAETGLRIGEAIEARFGDVDFGAKRLKVERQFYRGKVRKPKGGTTRRVTHSQDLSQAFWAQLDPVARAAR